MYLFTSNQKPHSLDVYYYFSNQQLNPERPQFCEFEVPTDSIRDMRPIIQFTLKTVIYHKVVEMAKKNNSHSVPNLRGTNNGSYGIVWLCSSGVDLN